jgi:Bacterial Ig-like domain (group 3)/Divergent InlB B-repeat domain
MKTQSRFIKSALLASLLLAFSLPMLAQAPETVRQNAHHAVSADHLGQTASGSRTGTGTVMAVGTDNVVLVTSQSAQGANDSVSWNQLGADGTLLAASVSATSTNGVAVTGSLAGPNSTPAVVCAATVCSWTGTGFATGDTLLWTSDAANGGNGPLTLALGKSIAGGGALIQADAPGQFTAQIQAYNGATLLGTLSVTSDANGDPAYIGVQDQTGANITSLTFSLTNCASTCTDFALDTAYLNDSSASNTFALTVNVSGSGSGATTSSPAGISCPGTCVANFTSGTSVTLNESPAAGSTFAGWTGACSGSGACSISMSAAESVTASFQSKTITTTTTLTVSSAQANAGSGVTFTAKVSPTSGNTAPTGTVTFNNGATPLGVVQLSSGTATLTTSSLTAGSYSVTAAYSGDTNSAGSSSTAVSLMVVDFTVTGQSTLSVVRGQSVQTSLTVTPQPLASFTPTVTFSCSGLPAQSTCTFNPSSVSPNGAALATTLTIQTTAPSAGLQRASTFGHGSGLLFALLLPGFLGILSMKRQRILLHARFVALLATLTLSMICWTACGTLGLVPPPQQNPGTPAGAATVTVTATSSGASPISKQVVIQLTVQ